MYKLKCKKYAINNGENILQWLIASGFENYEKVKCLDLSYAR